MSLFSQVPFDFGEDTFGIPAHRVVPESEDYETLPLEEIRPSLIGVLTADMAITVDFDHELAFQAYKVDDVRIDRKLAPKLVTAELPILDVAPKQSFCISQLTTQSASA